MYAIIREYGATTGVAKAVRVGDDVNQPVFTTQLTASSIIVRMASTRQGSNSLDYILLKVEGK